MYSLLSILSYLFSPIYSLLSILDIGLPLLPVFLGLHLCDPRHCPVEGEQFLLPSEHSAVQAASFCCFQAQVVNKKAAFIQTLLVRDFLVLEKLPVRNLSRGNHPNFMIIECVYQTDEPPGFGWFF